MKYICAICEKEFVSDYPDEQAKKEFEDTFHIPAAEGAVVCDECFKELFTVKVGG